MRASRRACATYFWGILLIGVIVPSMPGDEMVVISTLSGVNATAGTWEWVVPNEQFAKAVNLWDPDSGKFPVDLNQYCQMAQTNVMSRHKWSSLPELALVHVRQIHAQIKSNDASFPPLRRTVVDFHFREPGSAGLGPVKPVMMLLDGTIATMRRR
jgi:hypothetical protein